MRGLPLARRATLAVLYVLLVVIPAAAQGSRSVPGHAVTDFTDSPGAPSAVWALAKDREGYLWVGSTQGLYRFDGFVFEPWGDLSPDPLAGSRVRALQVDGSGNLWVAFNAGGVTRISNRRARNFGEADGLKGTGFRALAIDASGTVWAGSRRGLFSIAGERWLSHEQFAEAQVTSLLADAHGGLWVGTSDAIYHASVPGAAFTRVTRVPADADGVQGLCVDTAGRLVRTDAARGFAVVGAVPPTDREQGIGVGVHCGRDGSIWVATAFAGLWHVPPTRPGSPDITAGLLAYGAFAVLEDADGHLWVGAIDGLYRLTSQPLTTIADLGVVAAVVSGRNRGMWVGTFDGVRHFDRQRDSWTQDGAYLRGARTRAMHVAADGTVWVATSNGVASISPARAVHQPSWGTALTQIDSITSAPDGVLWMFDRQQGLVQLTKGTLRRLGIVDELRGAARTVIHVDRQGQLWVVSDALVAQMTSDGRVGTRFTPADGVSPSSVGSVYEDRRGAMWFGDFGAITRIHQGVTEKVQLPSGRPGGVGNTLTQSMNGEIWLGLGNRIIRFHERTLDGATASRPAGEAFSILDGLPAPLRTISDSASARSPAGDLWFVTDEGIAIIDPDRVNRHQGGGTSTRITSVEVDERTVAAIDRAVLEPGVSRVRITFSALDLVTSHRQQFRYRLDGFDSDWIDAEGRRAADYTNLAPGAYVFHVSAARDGHDWIEPGTTWVFTVAPHFYETGWFAFGVVLALAGLTYGAWRLRFAAVRRRFAMMLGERARISREIHDTLLQGYVGVALELQGLAQSPEPERLASRIVRLRQRIDDQIEEAREAIWNLRSPALDHLDLAAAIRLAGDRIIEGDTGVALDVAAEGSALPGPSRIERELLVVAQEAMTNAVRHGRPSSIRVAIATTATSVRLMVTDDGAGFEPARTDGRHVGLTSMRERVEGLGGELLIVSSPGNGTRVEALVPLPHLSE
jgi:signal transduction histidine kinase/ligand-binding sensor domain-containing protein